MDKIVDDPGKPSLTAQLAQVSNLSERDVDNFRMTQSACEQIKALPLI
ncbi:hypothetical protein [Pseudodonghicola xiamenensis]|nr:hypothetical protein [Pseudodonghicola xiamenensis]